MNEVDGVRGINLNLLMSHPLSNIYPIVNHLLVTIIGFFI